MAPATKLMARTTGSKFFDGYIPFVCHKVPLVIPFIGIIRPIIGRRHISGVTLIELIVTLTIGVILLAIAAPAMTNFVQSNRFTSATNDFILDLSVARSEAMKRGTQTAVCRMGNGTTCVGTGGWDSGWIVFADVDTNAQSGIALTASDVVLRAHDRLPSGITLPNSANIIIYGPQGDFPQGVPADFDFCDSKLKKQRKITFSQAGRHSVAEGTC